MPAVNDVGEPCAGEPHARFDGRELETEQAPVKDTEKNATVGNHPDTALRDLPPGTATAPAPDPTPRMILNATRGP